MLNWLSRVGTGLLGIGAVIVLGAVTGILGLFLMNIMH